MTGCCSAAPPRVWIGICINSTACRVERVSLREGCVLAYQNPDGPPLSGDPEDEAPELLTMMAVDYINMGVIKLQKSNVPA